MHTAIQTQVKTMTTDPEHLQVETQHEQSDKASTHSYLRNDLDSKDVNSEAQAVSIEKEDVIMKTNELREDASDVCNKAHEVAEDFIRNFLARLQMFETLQTFEQEWHALMHKGVVASKRLFLPDQYKLNSILEETNLEQENEIRELQASLDQAKCTLNKMLKEKDLHRMHHKRLAQEKSKLLDDLKRLKSQCSDFKPKIEELEKKYQNEMRKRTMVTLDRDKLKSKLETLMAPLTVSVKESDPQKSFKPITRTVAVFPEDNRPNLTSLEVTDSLSPAVFTTSISCKAHTLSVSNIALHPKKRSVAISASDDGTWKMWKLPEAELMMSGEGHADWISGVDIHPDGASLATGSGDGTVKIWNFQQQKCVKTFSENQAIWSVKFHEMGELLATSSLDHVARLWDLISEKCRTTFRGHADSVNELAWLPFSNTLCTASSDKTISLWSAHDGMCQATFYGHRNSVNSCSFAPNGQMFASCDADGSVRLWDIRSVKELLIMETAAVSANRCVFDHSSKVVLSAYDDGRVRLFSSMTGEEMHAFIAHEGSVQSVICGDKNEFVITAGVDKVMKYWSAELMSSKNF